MSNVDSVQNSLIMVAGEIQIDFIQERNVAENVLVVLKLIKENTVKKTMYFVTIGKQQARCVESFGSVAVKETKTVIDPSDNVKECAISVTLEIIILYYFYYIFYCYKS